MSDLNPLYGISSTSPTQTREPNVTIYIFPITVALECELAEFLCMVIAQSKQVLRKVQFTLNVLLIM